MESQPQNPEFRINPENFHPCVSDVVQIVNLYSEAEPAHAILVFEPRHVISNNVAF